MIHLPFFTRRNDHDKVTHAKKSDDILDGIIREISSSEDLSDKDQEYIDLDEEHKQDQEQLKEAYQKIGITGCKTDAKVKQAYYQKRQEIRSYSLKDENRILLDLKNAYELIMNHPEEFRQTDEGAESSTATGTQDEIGETEVPEKLERVSDDLLSWDDLMVEIDSDYKVQRKKKARKRGILLVTGFMATILIISGFLEIRKIQSFSCELQDNAAIDLLAHRKIKLKHDQKVVIDQENIVEYSPEGDVYIPLLHIYLQKCNSVIEKGIATINVTSIMLYRYTISDEDQVFYEPVHVFQYKTSTQLDLEGTWYGFFSTSMENKNSNSAVITITKDQHGLTGVCEIEADNGKKGSYISAVEQVTDTVDVNITGKEWIDKPTFFIMSDFIAYYDVQNEELLPISKNDNIFTFSKEKKQ